MAEVVEFDVPVQRGRVRTHAGAHVAVARLLLDKTVQRLVALAVVAHGLTVSTRNGIARLDPTGDLLGVAAKSISLSCEADGGDGGDDSELHERDGECSRMRTGGQSASSTGKAKVRLRAKREFVSTRTKESRSLACTGIEYSMGIGARLHPDHEVAEQKRAHTSLLV